MPIRFYLLLILSSLFTTGCYSQLHYTEAVYGDGYYWGHEPPDQEIAPNNLIENEYSSNSVLTGFRFFYKDYAAAEWYRHHGFGSQFDTYYGMSWDPLFYNPNYTWYSGYAISISSLYPFHSTHYYASTPLHFGPWVCWDPPYYFPSYYPSSVTIFIGGGYGGPLYYPGVSKGKAKSRTYGRRGIGTNRVKAGRENTPRSGILDNVRNITLPNSKTGTVRTRGTNRSGTIGTSSNNGPRVRSTGRSSSGSTSRSRSRGN